MASIVLGHVVINVQQPEAVTQFFEQEMNFRISDYIENAAFMRCFPNPFHHSLAIVPGPENRLNHVNFLVHSLDDFGQAMNRAKRQNAEIVFGPGRHPPSGSIFLYFLDPDAMTFEFSTGMEEFPETGGREPLHMPLSMESLDYWGGSRDPRHGSVGRFASRGVDPMTMSRSTAMSLLASGVPRRRDARCRANGCHYRAHGCDPDRCDGRSVLRPR